MFDPNDIFISILGNERLVYLGINLDLYSNFSFRDKLHINVVYNGEKDLTKLEDKYDSLNVLSENRGYYAGALDGINTSLKNLIESDRSIGVIHNFDYLFFYDSPFEKLIDGFIKANKSVLMWKMKNDHLPERAIFQTDCFVITKEFAKQVYPISPKDDTTIFYRKELAKVSGGDIDIMEEWFFQRLINVIMPENLDELNNHEYTHEMPQQHIKIDHDMVMDKLSCYCFFITGESKNIAEEMKGGKTVEVLNPPEGVDKGVYDSRYHSIHTHHYEILRPLLIMFRYNLNNKKFKTIDEFIDNKNSVNVAKVIAEMLTD
tara:strand:- start:426 stop:1379 length:954 start_codon:yes stop_codon:yes gene_type:complete